MTEITSIGNAGFRVVCGERHVYVDAFYRGIPEIAERPALRATAVTRADVLLFTHAHFDHFLPGEAALVAMRTHAKVVGPAAVIAQLKARLPAESLVEMEPPRPWRRRPASSVTAEAAGATITAYRTFHGREHNSYLVELPGFRFLHDGDNEDTRILPVEARGRLDALLIGPWQGSGWVEFVEKLRPTRYFLMHLTNAELDAHAAGQFLPPLCDRVPDGIMALRPGERWRC